MLEQKAKRDAEAAAEKERERERQKINPFSVRLLAFNGPTLGAADAMLNGQMGAAPAGAAGGLGASLFGGGASAFGNPFSTAPAEAEPTSEQPPGMAKLSISSSGDSAGGAQAEHQAEAGPSRPPTTYGPPIPAYQPPQYLSTFDEYIPRPDAGGKGKLAQYLEDGDKAGRKAGAAQDAAAAGEGGGGAEQWERVLPKGVDEVFERFVSRLEDAQDGDDQVLRWVRAVQIEDCADGTAHRRYDFGATPLPYSSKSTLYQKLFPKTAPGQPIAATRSSAYSIISPARRSSRPSAGGPGNDSDDPDSDDEEASELERRYHPEGVVPPCPRCGAMRVFEMQLVPGLISALTPESLTTEGSKRKTKKKKSRDGQSAEERRKEIEALLAGRSTGGGDDAEGGAQGETGLGEVSETGMEWGTVMVFGCKADCVGFGEEWVGVEWEEMV